MENIYAVCLSAADSERYIAAVADNLVFPYTTLWYIILLDFADDGSTMIGLAIYSENNWKSENRVRNPTPVLANTAKYRIRREVHYNTLSMIVYNVYETYTVSGMIRFNDGNKTR